MAGTFIHDDFLLQNNTAKELFHNYAVAMPVIDFHNHLDPQEIYEDHCYDNIADVWLGGDHYKWRAMRANGVPERLVTGDGKPYDKFLAWADTVQNCIGNPLYHWTHMELKRYFGIDTLLSPESAPVIWEKCNSLLKTSGYSVRALLSKQNVEILCTTDDPIDSLEWHKKIADEDSGIQVLPTFRPDNILAIENSNFHNYVDKLGRCTGSGTGSFDQMMDALKQRLGYFIKAGCRVTDHSLEGSFFLPASHDEVSKIYKKRLEGDRLCEDDIVKYRGFVLTELAREYSRHDLVMQLHIGAIRNNSSRMLLNIGANAGFDSLNDFNYASQLSMFLNTSDLEDKLPKTVLYYLNPKDAEMLAAMAGNFQGNDKNICGKIQLGPAWWFCDHKRGMEHQMSVLADTGMLSTFIGMLTDSRSFLSFPRHEYFRRILCNIIGKLVENGEYPHDMEYLGKFIKNICYFNAKTYFNL